MPFNNEKHGIINEIDFINTINKKRIKDLPINYQILLLDLFKKINYHHTVYAYKNNEKQKTDIYIRLNDDIKRISIKKGVKNSVHAENITDFIHFLISNHMPRDLVIAYLKYHYGDGTTNGKGVKRLSNLEAKVLYRKELDEINKFLNQDYIVDKAIERFVTKGRNDNHEIDCIIYGVPEDFLWILKDDIKKIIHKKKDMYSSGIHVGPLFIQPQNRCINRNPLYENKRYFVQVKWYELCDNIIENMNDKKIEKSQQYYKKLGEN